jgi:hypothetical protein
MTSRTSAGTTSLSLTLLAASLANAIVMLDATVVNVAMERIKAFPRHGSTLAHYSALKPG